MDPDEFRRQRRTACWAISLRRRSTPTSARGAWRRSPAKSRHRPSAGSRSWSATATFRYVPADLRVEIETGGADAYLNELNEALLERLQSSGEAFVSNAVIRGRYLLRACIVNFHSEAADVEALPEIVVRLGRDVDASLRSAASGG
jgi:hypothetical protein